MGRVQEALSTIQNSSQLVIPLLAGLRERLSAADVDYAAAEQVMYHIRRALDDAVNGCQTLEECYTSLVGGHDEEEALLFELCQCAFAIREAVATVSDLYQPPEPQMVDFRWLGRYTERVRLFFLASRG